VFISKPIRLPAAVLENKIYRADLEFIGIDHSGASYEGRVFLNNQAATYTTPKEIKSGYAGTIYIFGHGGCFGNEGHCEVKDRNRRYDLRSSHPLTRTNKRLIVTEPLRAIGEEFQEIIVSIVPVISKDIERWITKDVDLKNVVKLERILVNAYR
jgi:tyrosinase